MKPRQLPLLFGMTLGAFAAFWLLTQRRTPTSPTNHAVERDRETLPDWIELG